MTARLPTPGRDAGSWGGILNDFLSVSHNANGTLKTHAVQSAGGVTTSQVGTPSGVASLNSSGLVPTTQLGGGTSSSSNYLRGDGTWAVPSGAGSSTLASDTDVAIVSPANDQVLTYSSTSQKWLNQTPATVPVVGAAGSGASNALSANDPTTTNSRSPSGTASGDLTGSYPNPTVAKLNGITAPSIAPTTSGQVLTSTSTSATAWQTPATAPVTTVFGRSGAVVATNGDYTAAQVGALPSTDDLSAIATANATAGNISMNSHKITGLTNGSNPQDAVAFVQLPAAATPLPLNQGGTGLSAASDAALLSGLGAVPVAGATFTGYVAPAVVSLTFASSITINAALGNDFRLTLTASTGTLANPTSLVDGQAIRIRITQGAGGSFTLAYGSAYDFGVAGAPTLSTAAGKVDILGFVYDAALSAWCYLGSGLGF